MKKYFNKENALYWLQYTLLFLITAAGVFVWFGIYKKSFCWTTDTLPQYIPKASYFVSYVQEWITDILHGDFEMRMYDFSQGMGDQAYLRTEPIYWLLLLFGKNNVEYGYGFLILFRFYLSGAAMSVFLRYIKYTNRQSLTASMVYTFCGFALFGGMRHGHFLISMIMLPLLLMAMEEIYRKKRWYLCTIFVALNLLCGYYFMYMNTFFMGIYFLIRFFCGEEEKSVKAFLLRMRTIICSYLLGVAIGNFTLFNTFAGYLGSSRSGEAVSQRVALWSYGDGWYTKLLERFLVSSSNPGHWLVLGFIPLAYLCVELLFIRKGNRQLKIGFLVGTVFCMFPVFGYIFSGFSLITNRWCYAYALVVAMITAKMADELLSLTKKELILIFVFLMPYLYVGIGKYILGKKYLKTAVMTGIILLLIYAFIAFLNMEKKIPFKAKKGMMTVMIVGLLWLIGMERFAPMFGNMISEFTNAGEVLTQSLDTPLAAADEIDDEDFYRVYSNRLKSQVHGAPMILGIHATTYFNSTLTRSIVDYYRELGLTSWSLVRFKGFDCRGFIDAMNCVKYYIKDQKDTSYLPYGFHEVQKITRDDMEYTIFENENVLPIANGYDKVISYEDFAQLDTGKKQEVMLQAAVVDTPEDQQGYQLVTADQVEITGKEIPITKIECGDGVEFDGKTLSITDKEAEMTLYFDGLPQSETYLIYENLHRNATNKVNMSISTDDTSKNVNYMYAADKYAYNTKQKDYLINLGYSEEGKTFCKISFSRKCKMTVDDITVFCQPMENLGTYAEDRKSTSLENVQIGKNTVTGTVNAAQDTLLAYAVPYQSGWKAYVDGEETAIKCVNLMQIGIDVPKGEHEVVLRFTLPGIQISIAITAAALIVFAAALIIRRKRNNAA